MYILINLLVSRHIFTIFLVGGGLLLKFKRAIPKFYQPNSEENFSKGHLFCQKNSSGVVNSERKKKFEKRKHHELCDFSFIHIQLLSDI